MKPIVELIVIIVVGLILLQLAISLALTVLRLLAIVAIGFAVVRYLARR